MNPTALYVIKSLILPPGLFALLLIIALLAWRFARHLALWLVMLTAFLITILSMPIVSHALAYPLQYGTNQVSSEPMADAIVVLSAGRYAGAPEYGQDTVSGLELSRLRYALQLYREKKLPVLFSGGRVFGEKDSESVLMEKVWQSDFQATTPQLETQSQNTYQNAQFSSIVLKNSHQKKVYLVTDAIHMKRAKWAFTKFGLDVIPAATNFMTLPILPAKWMLFLPSMKSFSQSVYCLHEYLGVLWYWARYM